MNWMCAKVYHGFMIYKEHGHWYKYMQSDLAISTHNVLKPKEMINVSNRKILCSFAVYGMCQILYLNIVSIYYSIHSSLYIFPHQTAICHLRC